MILLLKFFNYNKFTTFVSKNQVKIFYVKIQNSEGLKRNIQYTLLTLQKEFAKF